MRSPANKPIPKKGVSKTTLKAKAIPKQIKKKTTSPKPAKNSAKKPLAKNTKKKSNKDDDNKNEGESSTGDKSDSSPDVIKPGTSKSSHAESTKKTKKEPKEKKDSPKETATVKKVAKSSSKANKKDKKVIKKGDKDEVKYKINVGAAKKPAAKFSKAKTLIKKSNPNINQKKKAATVVKNDSTDSRLVIDESYISKDDDDDDNDNVTMPGTATSSTDRKNETSEIIVKDTLKEMPKLDTKFENASPNSTPSSPTDTIPPSTTPDTPKSETERPPKFFTSSRSPRTVDIDVKCFKTSKGNLSVSERFLSLKCETKADDNSKPKPASNALVSQGPDIDVYTFTEKVDSPKSILSDFRSPVNKNVGRVRPIARVKGTVIDKKTESEKKKYSPHRPIEEVVKQLKANKRSEELNSTETVTSTDVASPVESTTTGSDKDVEDKPKPIVSKSYKMVARKSSITGKPFSPIKFLDQDQTSPTKTEKPIKKETSTKKNSPKAKKQQKKSSSSDDEIDNAKFSLNPKSLHYTSSDESVSESNDDNDTKESSGSDVPKSKKTKMKKYKRITDSAKKTTSKELRELSKDSLVDLKDDSILLGKEKPSKRRLKLLSMWSGPKKHRMASLNAIAKVHCLYENESRTHMELGLMKTIDRQILPSTSKTTAPKKVPKPKEKEIDKSESNSDSDYENKKEKKDESSESSSDDSPPQRSLRGVPGIRSAGKYWDPKSSTSSSEDSEMESKKKPIPEKKKATPKSSSGKSDTDKPPAKMKKTTGVPVKKKRNRNEVVMDLKDMVVQKRMASLNATAILAASYEKRSPKSNKDETTSDSCSDESFSQKPKNVLSSGVKSETKNDEPKKEIEEELHTDRKQKVEVIVNQESDVTITGVYSTHHHEGFCTVSGMQYRISSTSHTQTTATANCEKEGCSREDGARYTPLSALSSMQPPADHAHSHPHPVPELGGLARRAAGCSSAFSAPSPSAHHEPGYYQPAGPLIKESGVEAERTLTRYHPPPHYHPPHPVIPQYGPHYYPPEVCYRYYRPTAPHHQYHMPQPEPQIVGVSAEAYPPPQYYSTAPCYAHQPPRVPYIAEYRTCTCPLNSCPKNVLIGPATGKPPTGGGPADVASPLVPPGGPFRPKVRACLDTTADTHGSGKDPPAPPPGPGPSAVPDAPNPAIGIPAIGGASPKREIFDVRDNRLGEDIKGPAEALGPPLLSPSPARGSAGGCAPHAPPPVAPRRARLGKAMARRSLAGDDTGLLLSPQPTPSNNSDGDDDVLAISPPLMVPIDLSSSDERSTPLVDVKKENEGPTYTSPRKTDALALREHNSTTTVTENSETNDAAKAVKRRYSKPKLEIDMIDVQLEDACKTNGIGEHVKLQKRRKVSSDQIDGAKIETITKETKKVSSQKTKRTPKTPSTEKKPSKRRMQNGANAPKAKKILMDISKDEDPRIKNVAALPDDKVPIQQKTKSALALDNLLRKNSKSYGTDLELNPAELFITSDSTVKKTLNINNNVVDSGGSVNGVKPKTILAVSQMLEKKTASKNACKMEKVDSKIVHASKTVLSSPTDIHKQKEDSNVVSSKCEKIVEKLSGVVSVEKSDLKHLDIKEKCESRKNSLDDICGSLLNLASDKVTNTVAKVIKTELNTKHITAEPIIESQHVAKDIVDKPDYEEMAEITNEIIDEKSDNAKLDKTCKRNKLSECKVNGENKVKLLVPKKPVIKTDEATLVVEDACASPTPSLGKVPKTLGRRTRRRRSGPRVARRLRRPPAPLDPPSEPRSQPQWSNGWSWDGEPYVSKVYLSNDARQDRNAHCWLRMRHDTGDRVSRGDCVLLRASSPRAQPFVARVASLWENPDDSEMMMSLVWYYRPEHTELGRQPSDAPDEVFASRHRDANSVACIEDKCYVLTFNEYCRYRKRLKAAEEGITVAPSIVPPMPASEVTPALATNDSKLPPSVSPELVLFCRKIYDFRSKKLQVPTK